MSAAPMNAMPWMPGTGRQIWHYRRPKTAGMAGDAASGTNRGAAVAGGRLFMETDSAHIRSPSTASPAKLIWETEMADWHLNYFATSAPLDRRQPSGWRRRRRRTRLARLRGGLRPGYRQGGLALPGPSPKPGEPGSETWQGKGIEHGGGPTWFTGTYDAQLDTVYWPSGNPSAEYNGDDRLGDDLYTDCILALDAKTGKLKWHFQTTPHDLWDWDAAETPVVVYAAWKGQPRKLLIQANRNGFFYVWDRTDGKVLLAKPFVRNLSWASGIAPDGHPIFNPNQEPTAAGTKVCPSQDGATNWFSPSFNPTTGLFYVQTFEKCSTYTKRDPGPWQAGKEYLGGSQRTSPGDRAPERILRSHRREDRQGDLGIAATGTRDLMGRHARHRHQPGDLRSGRWLAHGRGRS